MEKVTSYKISDGRIFESKAEAEKEQFAIDMRGIVQSSYAPGTAVNLSQFVQALAQNHEKLATILSKYRKSVKAAEKTEVE